MAAKTATLKKYVARTVVSVIQYYYKVDFGPDVHPQLHIVDKNKVCNCALGAKCPAIEAVALYLKATQKYAPPRPLGHFDKVPNACPVCGARTRYQRRWSSKRRGAGWECIRGGSLHYWKSHTAELNQQFSQKEIKTADQIL